LHGTAHVIPIKGGEKLTRAEDAYRITPPRDTVARMTALFTEMTLKDGTSVPICAVLFDAEWRIDSPKLHGEGIPVLDSKYFGAPATPTWSGDEWVRCYYPPP
jgi:hypothetical protein